MKKYLISALIVLTLHMMSFHQTRAQSLELVGGNILNGAITGTALGIAVMGLNNSSDFGSVRVGLGVGILGGTGIALYDISTLPQGQQFFISGVFNDGSNSSIIILLDTLYGATAGLAVGSAFSLITNSSIMNGFQYGASAGAWAGFGFGIIDSFFIAERNRDFVSNRLQDLDSMLTIRSEDSTVKLLQPELIGMTDLSGAALQYRLEPALKLFTYSRQF